jgi:hypothetical protein
VSLVPVLKGGNISSRPLYWHYPHYGNQGGEPSSILRVGDWKLIHYYEDGRNELYDLESDPGEQNDVASQHADRTREMAAQLQAWLAEVGARYPTPNPNYDAQLAARQQAQIRTVGIQSLEKQAARFLDPDYDPKNRWWGSQVAD